MIKRYIQSFVFILVLLTPVLSVSFIDNNIMLDFQEITKNELDEKNNENNLDENLDLDSFAHFNTHHKYKYSLDIRSISISLRAYQLYNKVHKELDTPPPQFL
jgi:hypothetical protein